MWFIPPARASSAVPSDATRRYLDERLSRYLDEYSMRRSLLLTALLAQCVESYLVAAQPPHQPALLHKASRLRTMTQPSTPPRASNPCLVLRGGGGLLNSVAKAPAGSVLALTIVFEIFATTSMKLAVRNKVWYAGVFIGYALCFTLFPVALRSLPLSIAYATWSGVGTAASVLIGVLLFGEVLTPLKLLWVLLIIGGVVGLNL